ncbi:MAG: hypothetical protein CML43_13825 [Rhodobacteraceae bacterium]|nr:hypothetical protein [Paracoccaceae bacterium]
MVHYADALHVVGGETEAGIAAEVWTFLLDVGQWVRMPTQGCEEACPFRTAPLNATHCQSLEREVVLRVSCVNTVRPPALRDHTVTLIDDDGTALVLGGITNDDEFAHDVHLLDVANRAWRRLAPAMHRFTEVAGHTAVFHPASRGVYVYGGFRPYHGRYSDARAILAVYNVDSGVWAEVSRSPGRPG